MKMQHFSLSVLSKPLLVIALAAGLQTSCEDKQAQEAHTSDPVLADRAPDSAVTIKDPEEGVRYPEFERQERVERIAALASAQTAGKESFGICATCHGIEGFGSRDGVIPRLAGQQEKVLIEKLVEISEGVRHRPEMEPLLSHIDTDDKIAALASYISAMPDPISSFLGAGDALALGQEVFTQYCVSCHGPNGEGDGEARVPRIAGWDYASVRRTLIRQGADRSEIHETGMSDLVSMLNEAEIDALADHVSRLVPSPGAVANEP